MSLYGYTTPPMDKRRPQSRSGNKVQDAIERLKEQGITGPVIRQKILAGENPFPDQKPLSLFAMCELLSLSVKRNQALTRAFSLKAMGRLTPNARAASTAVSFALKVLSELDVIHTEEERISLK